MSKKLLNLIQILLFITITSQKEDTIIGCEESSILPSSKTIKLLKISFQESCTNLEKCIKNLHQTSKCVLNFKKDMEAQCEDYPNIRFIKKSYCKNLSQNNFSLILSKLLNSENLQIISKQIFK